MEWDTAYAGRCFGRQLGTLGPLVIGHGETSSIVLPVVASINGKVNEEKQE